MDGTQRLATVPRQDVHWSYGRCAVEPHDVIPTPDRARTPVGPRAADRRSDSAAGAAALTQPWGFHGVDPESNPDVSRIAMTADSRIRADVQGTTTAGHASLQKAQHKRAGADGRRAHRILLRWLATRPLPGRKRVAVSRVVGLLPGAFTAGATTPAA